MLEATAITENPESGRKWGKFKEITDAVTTIPVGQILRFTMPNKKEAESARSTIQRIGGHKYTTRVVPANGSKDGPYFLFAKRLQ